MYRHVAGLAEIVDDFEAAVAFYRDTLGLPLERTEETNYAVVQLPGVLHFGIWHRPDAAEMILGDRNRADEVPLGFSIELEADDLDIATAAAADRGARVDHAPVTMPWGQRVAHLRSATGAIIGLSDLPERRRLSHDVEAVPEPEAQG